MARYTGPVCRLCRRERTKLFLKGERCYSLKCPVSEAVTDRHSRAYPPGEHGRDRMRQGSEYLAQLREKQKARRIYGILEKQFRNMYEEANRQGGITGENLLRNLELRLDNVVFRAGWGASRRQARQFVRHGHVSVNGKRVTIPSYRVRKGDIVMLREATRGNFLGAPQHGHPGAPDPGLARDRRRRLLGVRPQPAAARAHRRAHSGAVDRRALLEVAPSPATGVPTMLIIQRPTVEVVDEEQNNRQRFAIGPLDPGFGTTLGNSLRRTLLSSIPGGAVTQLRFDEALHEFTTLPGVKEDVTDIILNLKDLLVRVQSDEPVTLRLDVRGPADATAADLQLTSDVEILNPDLHIASVNAKGRLAVDVTVERGRGYASADKNKKSSTIGVIPIDSIFSPVHRVTFDIEPVRVEQSTNYDRLVLDIETDGTISPREALASAGDTLRNLVSLVADLEEAPQGLELGDTGTTTSGSPDLDLRIEELDLSERPRNCLKRAQINTIGELVERTMEDLLAITNFGQKSADEVVQRLDERGLSLRTRD